MVGSRDLSLMCVVAICWVQGWAHAAKIEMGGRVGPVFESRSISAEEEDFGSLLDQVSPFNKMVTGGKGVGGSELTPHSWPFLVRVVMKYQGQYAVCGGSILDEFHILTAAHCCQPGVPFSEYKMFIFAGRHNMSDSSEPSNQARIVSDVFIHEGYNKTSVADDVAVLKLKAPLTFTPEVQTVSVTSDANCPEMGDTCYIAGWGKTSDKGKGQSSVPMKVDASVPSRSVCAFYLDTNYSPHYDDTLKVCAGSIGHSACNGDSGGPLMCTCNGEQRQVGIASFVSTCGCSTGPTFYARVTGYQQWINDKLAL